MLRQGTLRPILAGIGAIGLLTLATIGLTATTTEAERKPECAQLARLVAGQARSMLGSLQFRETERQAFSVCARDPAAFRKLIRIS